MKPTNFSIVADTHGDQLDPLMEDKFFRWVSEFKPKIRIHGGDLFDFRPLRNGASLDERQESMRADFEAGKAFLTRYFKEGVDNYLLLGNHDQRLWDAAEGKDGVIADLAQKMIQDIEYLLRKHRVKWLPYDSRLGILRLGQMKVIHGFKSGQNASAATAKIYGNVIHGHDHSQGCAPVENPEAPSLAMGTGCLCKIDMPYNARQTNKLRHQQGWVFGTLFDDGTYQAYQAKRVGDYVHAATTLKTY